MLRLACVLSDHANVRIGNFRNMRNIKQSCIQHEHALHHKQDMSILQDNLICLLYYILYCISGSIFPTGLATLSCSTEHHVLVLASGYLLKLSAVNCIASLPFSALKITTTTTLSFIVNRCSYSSPYFNSIVTANGKNETKAIVETKMVKVVALGY